MTTSYPCPRCGAAAALPGGCPTCGAGPDPDAAEVIRLDGELADLRRQIDEARARLHGLDQRIQDTYQRRARLAAGVVARHARTPAPQGSPPATAPVAAAEPGLSVLTVQNVLFALGGLLLVVAAAVFTAVAWAQVGVTGRALLLAGATAAILAVPPFAARRGLTAAAETLAAVGLLMILLDGFAAWAVDFLFVQDLEPSAYAAAVLTCTAVTALGYSRVTGLRGPRIAALVMAQPVVPLLAHAADAGRTGWSLAISAIAVLDVVVLRVRPARFALDGTGAVACFCAGLAGAAGTTIALADLVLASTPATTARAGGALLLPPLTLLVWALLARRPVAQAAGAGLLVVALGIAGTGWAWTLPLEVGGSGWQASRSALIALLLAAVAAGLRGLPAPAVPAPAAGSPTTDPGAGPQLTGPAAGVAQRRPAGRPAADPAGGSPSGGEQSPLRRWVPPGVRDGARFGALIVAAAPAVTVALAAAVGALRSVETAGRLWATPMDVIVTGPRPDMLLATVLTASAYAVLLPRRAHPDLGLTALAVLGFLVPAAAGLPWWAAAVAGTTVAAVALLLAARSRTSAHAAYRIVVCLVAATHAVVTGCGHAAVAAAVCAAMAVLGLVTAGTVRRAPRGADVGAGSLTGGLVAVPPAVWLALFAADVPVTTRVRVSLVLATLLCAVAHAVARRLPGYGPYALGVALLAAGTAPIWAMPGGDPPVLFAAAGVLLVVALLPLPAARAGGGAIAVLVPACTLVLLTAPDLAVVVVEPWAALSDIWSGAPPPQSPVGWSGVAALTAAVIAAAATGRLLARSTPDSASSAGTPPEGPSQPGSGPGPVVSPPAAAGWAAAPLAALVVPLVFAASGAAWPTVPIATMVTGLAGLLTIALVPARPRASGLLALVFGALVAAGTAGAAAGHGATIAALSLLVAASVGAGTAGRRESDRVTGWAVGTTAAVVLAYTVADLTGPRVAARPLFVLAAAGLVVALEAALTSRRPRERWAPFLVGHTSAPAAVLLTESPGWAALVCKLWALVLTVRAMRPGETRRARFRHAIAAGSVALLGWWLLLSSRDVATTEIYTLPAAVLAVVIGWFARRARPDLSSWSAYGAALAAAFLPTLAVVAGSTADEPHYPRRLLLGVGALLVLLAGARARLRAPVVTGGGTLLLVALHELVQFWDLLPRWVPLAVGGLLLVAVATTMEQRRRDLARLRAAVSRMA